ncbi:hypothetical protein [Deinococcus arcticus]|uniref:Uncharacterized protein n=1 Tax=Deinococcus arcticus TaxID=2136176 RepID=A0A2T3W5E2_9DEIO|nr:hypothetical protein [Deinococcus arcticus]PTA66983.1 hypothetical protein C8263_14805 [Deinococcus arcticus]
MNRLLSTALAASVLTLPLAAAQTPASWTAPRLSAATYVILDPKIEGNPNLVSAEQRASILAAMKRDSAGAIKRRYPKATVTEKASTPGAIEVRPVFVAPRALLPWAKLGARLEFRLPEGQTMVLSETFGISVLLRHQAEFVNYLYDQLAARLP